MTGAGALTISDIGDISLLIVDDCTVYREALTTVLRLNFFGSVGQAWDVPTLIGAVESVAPQVILLNMAAKNAETMLRAATSLGRKAPVIAVGVHATDEQMIVAGAEAGVAAYHMRSDSLADLLAIIASVLTGERDFPPALSNILLRRLSNLAAQRHPLPRGPGLTAREMQILGLLELGRSNQDIADQLAIAVHTVKNHVHNVLTKLGVNSRAEAAALSHSLRAERGSQPGTRSRSRQNWL